MKEEAVKKYTLKEKFASLGPGILIVGSFIGPGTITSSTRAGANYGFALWCFMFTERDSNERTYYYYERQQAYHL